MNAKKLVMLLAVVAIAVGVWFMMVERCWMSRLLSYGWKCWNRWNGTARSNCKCSDCDASDDNSGDDNSGDDNSGDDNSGDDNSGDDNSGDDNSGDDSSEMTTRDDM